MNWLARKLDALKNKQVPVESENRKCPYCNKVIEKEPKGKFKCPSCREEIHIQRAGKEIKLLTTDQRINLNAEKALRAAENKYFNFFSDLDISKKYLEQRRNFWFKKLGIKANYADLIWSVASELVQTFFKSGDYLRLSTLYMHMALMLHKEGRDSYDLLYESHRFNLLRQKEQIKDWVSFAMIITCGDQACPACRELDRKEFSIDEALDQMPLPVKGCTHEGGWCRCAYTYRILRS